nr:hypothetical protein [Planctomycetota bacterium]
MDEQSIPARQASPAPSHQIAPIETPFQNGDEAVDVGFIAGRQDAGRLDAFGFVLENLARMLDRLYPPNAAPDDKRHRTAALEGLGKELHRLAHRGGDEAANHAIIALKEMLREVEGLRERNQFFSTNSANAFSALNSTEHRVHDLGGRLDRLCKRLSAAVAALPATDRALLDNANAN